MAAGFLAALRQPLFRRLVPMRLRLLGRLNSPFDKDPGAVLALRIRSDAGAWAAGGYLEDGYLDNQAGPSGPGLRWKIAGRRLTVSRPGLPDLVLPLEGNRIVDLRDRMEEAGVEIAYYAEDPAVLTLGALALIPGEGDQDRSDGDHIHAFTKPLWALQGAWGRWLEEARDDGRLALRELRVDESTGEWSDLHASYFGLLRRPGEADAHLNMRTAYEWRRPRSNRFAIQKNIKVLWGKDVTVREPWREMWVLSEPGNELSGGHHMPNAVEFCYHTAQLRSKEYLDWAPLQAEAEADRPAGTLFLAPVTDAPPSLIDMGQDREVRSGSLTVGSWAIRDYDGQILDFTCALSDTFVLLNPSMSMTEVRGHSAVNDRDPGTFGRPLTFCKGEIVLSDAPPLGDLQGHLAGAWMPLETGEQMALSDAAGLSDHDWAIGRQPIDEWFQAVFGAGREDASSVWSGASVSRGAGQTAGTALDASGAGAGAGALASSGSQSIALVAPGAYDRGWRGRWDKRKWTSAGYPAPVISVSVTTQVNGPMASAGAAAATGAAALSTGIRLASAGAATASGAPALTAGNGMVSAGTARATGAAALSTAILAASAGAASAAGAAQLTAQAKFGSSGAATASGSAALRPQARFASSGAASASGSAALSVSTSPPAFVRSTSGAGSNTGTVTVPLSASGAGNKLIVMTSAWQSGSGTDSTPSAVSAGPLAGTFTERAIGSFGTTFGGGEGNQVSIWAADVAAGGAGAVTVDFANGGTYAWVVVAEFSGVASEATALDRTAAAGGAATTSPSVGPTLATQSANELVIALFGQSGANGDIGIDPATPGYTNLLTVQDSGSVSAISANWKVAGAAGAQSAAFGTLNTDTGGGWSAAIATFRPKP